jgi:hypothetical protein
MFGHGLAEAAGGSARTPLANSAETELFLEAEVVVLPDWQFLSRFAAAVAAAAVLACSCR